MNIIAIDIGNTNIEIGLFVNDQEISIQTIPAENEAELKTILAEVWEQVPYSKNATVQQRDGNVIVSSVNDKSTEVVSRICDEELDVKIKLIGKDINLPIEMGVENASGVGTDRVVAAAAAFAVIEDACVIADIGTAITIDLVDEQGTFLGGVIAPGFAMSAKALHENTEKLPLIAVSPPKEAIGPNTADAINSGIFYSTVGLLRAIAEKFAEELERWPQLIVTGGGADTIKKECDFVDSWVPHLVVRGIVLAFKKHLSDQAMYAESAKQKPTDLE